MREALAQSLLANVMGWTLEQVTEERPKLQALATAKYDTYQQFAPGMRFVERLASWLRQFEPGEERRIAYEFITTRLVYFSSEEVNHLASIAYWDHIRPLLLQRAAVIAGIDSGKVVKLSNAPEFLDLQKRCLFLGMSDGARIDVFRRSNAPQLSHEQIRQDYELSDGRVPKLIKELQDSLGQLRGRTDEPPRFNTIVLLDDWSASGKSILREEDGSLKGKLYTLHEQLQRPVIRGLVDMSDLNVYVVLYIATTQALGHIRDMIAKLPSDTSISYHVFAIYVLPPSIQLAKGDGNPMGALIEKYYDPKMKTEAHKVGGSEDVKYGFAKCGLPVVLCHNTPNNSIPLLWADNARMRSLFPRVDRHPDSK